MVERKQYVIKIILFQHILKLFYLFTLFMIVIKKINYIIAIT